MKLKGTYSSSVSYSVDDVVVSSDGNVYRCIQACKGKSFDMDGYWRRMIDQMEDTVVMMNLLKSEIETAISSVLPKVTSSDNGKILKVVSGEWAKADAE